MAAAVGALWRIHGQHGNVVYKGGLKQESEQCLTSTVTNGAHWMSPGKGRRGSFPKEWCENGESVSIDHSAGWQSGWADRQAETCNQAGSWNSDALLSFLHKLSVVDYFAWATCKVTASQFVSDRKSTTTTAGFPPAAIAHRGKKIPQIKVSALHTCTYKVNLFYFVDLIVTAAALILHVMPCQPTFT